MLRLNARARYAVRIMVRVATASSASPAHKRAIAEAEGISSDYVEQILLKLRSAALVVSHRGLRGGFSLARPAARISVKEVLEAVDGPLSLAPCTADNCLRASECATRPLWRKAEAALCAVLEQTTLADLAEQARALEENVSWSFQI